VNERIQSLIEQARVNDRGYFIYQYGGPNGHQSVEKAIDLELFAKLIIQNSFGVVLADGRFHDAKGVIRAAKSVAKENFGVE
jgi:hypothetical protein